MPGPRGKHVTALAPSDVGDMPSGHVVGAELGQGPAGHSGRGSWHPAPVWQCDGTPNSDPVDPGGATAVLGTFS